MTNPLISFFSLVVVGVLAATACNNDVDTSAWLPNYTESGYGGKGGGSSAGTGGALTGVAGEGGDAAANAGEGGAP